MRGLAVSFLFAFASLAAAGEFRSIAENGTPMYDAPSVRAKKLFVASRRYPVEVVINIDSWVKVRDQAGDLAWVEKKTLSDRRTVIVTAAVADVRQTANDQAALVFQAQQGVPSMSRSRRQAPGSGCATPKARAVTSRSIRSGASS